MDYLLFTINRSMKILQELSVVSRGGTEVWAESQPQDGEN